MLPAPCSGRFPFPPRAPASREAAIQPVAAHQGCSRAAVRTAGGATEGRRRGSGPSGCSTHGSCPLASGTPHAYEVALDKEPVSLSPSAPFQHWKDSFGCEKGPLTWRMAPATTPGPVAHVDRLGQAVEPGAGQPHLAPSHRLVAGSARGDRVGLADQHVDVGGRYVS